MGIVLGKDLTLRSDMLFELNGYDNGTLPINFNLGLVHHEIMC